jgi:hypothetical protein
MADCLHAAGPDPAAARAPVARTTSGRARGACRCPGVDLGGAAPPLDRSRSHPLPALPAAHARSPTRAAIPGTGAAMRFGTRPPQHLLLAGEARAPRDAAVCRRVVRTASTRRVRPGAIPRTALTLHTIVPRNPRRAPTDSCSACRASFLPHRARRSAPPRLRSTAVCRHLAPDRPDLVRSAAARSAAPTGSVSLRGKGPSSRLSASRVARDPSGFAAGRCRPPGGRAPAHVAAASGLAPARLDRSRRNTRRSPTPYSKWQPEPATPSRIGGRLTNGVGDDGEGVGGERGDPIIGRRAAQRPSLRGA